MPERPFIIETGKHGQLFVKPVFKGGIGKKGKAGLLGRAKDLKTALAEKEQLYFAEHQHGNAHAKANGVTFEAGVPARHEIYFSITDSTRFRAPTMTLTHMGGMDIEELDKASVATVPFDPALTEIGAPKEIISPLVQQLPKLWLEALSARPTALWRVPLEPLGLWNWSCAGRMKLASISRTLEYRIGRKGA